VSTARESTSRRAYLVGRKVDQALEDQNVGVGSCLLAIRCVTATSALVGDTVKKQKAGRTSLDKMPSSKSYGRKPTDTEDYFVIARWGNLVGKLGQGSCKTMLGMQKATVSM
jgi:hypothetical protein